MMARTDEELDRIFAAFDEDRRSAKPRPLSAWIAEHPDLSASFAHWATECQSLQAAEELGPTAEFERRSLQIGSAVLARLRFGDGAAAQISSLNDAARAAGAHPKDVARRSGIGITLFAKLNRRLIDSETIPGRLVELLADTLRVPASSLLAYLAQPPMLAEGAAYRAAKAPEAVGGQPFGDALRECADMTEEQKRQWL
ncbi:MAG TPA: hypothetical protein VKT77_19275 [Chthonomonadaceae bacterium]|nr:hypothetical protein [Chthonomonadaceae bacterium]